MDTAEIVFFIFSLLLMLAGLIGCILPAVPGVPVIWASALLFGLVTGFERIGSDYLLVFGALTVLSLVLDWTANIYGARKFGASKWGMLGAFAGMIFGLLVGALPGMIIGPFVGAVAAELIVGKESGLALKAGFGTFVGFIGGIMLKLVLGAVMIGVFIHNVIQ